MESLKEKVQKANIALHSALAGKYNTDEPHWRPENVAKVTQGLTAAADRGGRGSMLDLGCGTGFMINIGKKVGFKEIHGYDITERMIEQVDRTGPAKIHVALSDTGKLPAPSDHFDVATAYSFLHHLDEVASTLREAYRCLKPGGVLFCDLDPNYYFWRTINDLPRMGTYSAFVAREVRHVTFKDEEMNATHGVDEETFNFAEFNKNITGGLREEELHATLAGIGFKNIAINYSWFLGQGFVNNDESMTQAQRDQTQLAVDAHLQKCLPASRNLYKYLGFTCTK